MGKYDYYSRALIPRDGDWKSLKLAMDHFDSKMEISIAKEGIEASSCDHTHQGIDTTLDGLEKTFWNLKGNTDQTSNEYLVYQLTQPICIIKGVATLCDQ